MTHEMNHASARADTPDIEAQTLIVRPVRALFRQGVVTTLAVMTPIFAVLYWLTIPNGMWPLVLIVHGACLAFTGLIALAFAGASIQLSSTGIRERGFLGRITRTPSDRIGSALMVEVYRDSALDTQPQLFICDTDGRLATRMRGAFWSLADMDAVVDALEKQNIPIEAVESGMTMTELRRMRPDLLYWFERFPTLRSHAS